MKKIIYNKVYDTDTAQKMGSDNYGKCGDPDWWNEELYRKKTGEFFLYGEGGANSQYAKRLYANNWAESANIIPLTYKRAQEWAAEHLSANEYTKIFGKISKDDSIVRKEFSLRADSVEKLKRAASQRGITMVTLIEELIKNLET